MCKIVSEVESGMPVFLAWYSLPAKNFRGHLSFSASWVRNIRSLIEQIAVTTAQLRQYSLFTYRCDSSETFSSDVAEVFVRFVLFSLVYIYWSLDGIPVLSQGSCAGRSRWTSQSYREHKTPRSWFSWQTWAQFLLLQWDLRV